MAPPKNRALAPGESVEEASGPDPGRQPSRQHVGAGPSNAELEEQIADRDRLIAEQGRMLADMQATLARVSGQITSLQQQVLQRDANAIKPGPDPYVQKRAIIAPRPGIAPQFNPDAVHGQIFTESGQAGFEQNGWQYDMNGKPFDDASQIPAVAQAEKNLAAENY
jgi:uncharacterized coiled-coil protein SlyX